LDDAETGQRGFLLTSDQSFLAPYTAALPEIAADLNALASVVGSAAIEPNAVAELESGVDRKLAELRTTINLSVAGKTNEALAMVASGGGNAAMDVLRARVEAQIVLQADRAENLLGWATKVGEWLRFGAVAAILLAAGLAFVAVDQLRRRLASLISTSDNLVSARGDLVTRTPKS